MSNKPDPSDSLPPLYCARIEYDGTDLKGFQLQAQGRTVQGEVERTLRRLTQEPVRVVGAGRTDAGVHALGQIIAFRSTWRHSIDALQRGLDALLPSNISLHSLQLAAPGFHPRFSASQRWYRYQIGCWSGHAPLRARYVWELGPGLDLNAMQAAGDHLVGVHDFASFGRPPQGKNTVRHVLQARFSRQDDILHFDIVANAFLHHMVRNLVGTLVQVGRQQISPTAFQSILRQQRRSLSAPPAPPQGLILMAITYPNVSL
ncbi:MAG: tRNA pseudouridine(38-40) synthase TruA [Chloroflexi bacterium]|nr:tRNA pseudouridine(38-40) synthase TruA [Chloroflexota bacterium]